MRVSRLVWHCMPYKKSTDRYYIVCMMLVNECSQEMLFFGVSLKHTIGLVDVLASTSLRLHLSVGIVNQYLCWSSTILESKYAGIGHLPQECMSMYMLMFWVTTDDFPNLEPTWVCNSLWLQKMAYLAPSNNYLCFSLGNIVLWHSSYFCLSWCLCQTFQPWVVSVS